MWLNENVYDSSIHEASLKYGVPVELIKAVIGKESGFTANAMRPEPAYKCSLTGKVGDASIGLMQILYCTAQGEGFRGTVAELYDPHTNIDYGTRYLSEQLRRAYGNVEAALSAYNGGWNPSIGFGGTVTRSGITVCLARDTKTGKCIQSRTVPIGEYANQPYVDKAMQYYQYFRGRVATPPKSGGTTTPPLSFAHPVNTEPESGERDSRADSRIVGDEVRSVTLRSGVLAQFRVASGKKWVSIAGLVITALGFLCIEHRATLNDLLSVEWSGRLCGIVTLLGSVLASFGKGLADQRKGPRQENGYYIDTPSQGE
jgi:hypothetical protein